MLHKKLRKFLVYSLVAGQLMSSGGSLGTRSIGVEAAPAKGSTVGGTPIVRVQGLEGTMYKQDNFTDTLATTIMDTDGILALVDIPDIMQLL